MGGVRVAEVLAAQLDDEQERRARRLLLGKGAVLAHRLAHALAAESDDDEQSGRRDPARSPSVIAVAPRDCGRYPVCLVATAAVLELPLMGASRAPTSCLCVGCDGFAE